MTTDFAPPPGTARLMICQACGCSDARLRSDPHGSDPDLLCDSCLAQGLRQQEWWA